MTPLETKIIGLVYLVLGLLSLPFHFIVSLGILHSKLNRNRPAYIIWVARSVAEIGQLLIHALSGVCAISGREFCESVHMVLGNALIFFWMTSVFLHVLLSVDRFIIFVTSRFATKNTIETTYSLIAACIIGAAFCTAGCNEEEIEFRLEYMAWRTEKKSGFSTVINYVLIGLVILGFVCCSCVILFMADSRRKASRTRIPIKQTEVRIFMISTITFILMSTKLFMHHPLNMLLDNELQTGIIMNVDWILICSIPPFLVIWMSREINKSIRDLSIRHPKVNAVSVAI